ncbi:PilN domain-containing protein [Propionivibrio soli]|uniref:PilN domain-containing protein n=1 Tax=Propionivibrio soli TaxID=2976531 RepID=UPI0021E953D8|nr:PilN domain-containing protein [Propionivibrio soli]
MSQQINLYEDRLRPRRELATWRNVGGAALVVFVVTAIVAAWTGLEAKGKAEAAAVVQKQLADEQQKLAELTKAMGERKVSPAVAAELDSSRVAVGLREEILSALETRPLAVEGRFSAAMAAFARQAQPDLWLTGFDISAGGDEIEVRGRMLDSAKLPAYVQALGREPAFQGRRFAALEMRGVDPAEPKTAADTAKGDGVAAIPALHYVEFILRSEKARADAAKNDGRKQ